MQNFIRLLAASLFLSTTSAQAAVAGHYYVYGDFLYWKATEVINWAYDNSLSTPTQNITYKSNDFNHKPGFRLGAEYENDWDMGLYYTKYSTKTADSAVGNLKSGFFGGTVGLPTGQLFYNAGSFNININMDMIDWYFGKRFNVAPNLTLHPYIGLEGGWINQSMTAKFQGLYATTERIHNDFSGIGPKFGIDGALNFYQHDQFEASFLAGFSTAYLWGHWDLPDVFTDTSPRTIDVSLSDRNTGALVLQGMMGLGLSYQAYSVKLSYEINDWVAQCQIFDDATGGHNNDLLLQGLTLQAAYSL